MSRNESSLLFSLQELRDLEGERAQRERAALAAEEQQREAARQQELARKRAIEDEQQRLQDALRAAIVERDAQSALARRAVERHSTLALELAEAQLALSHAEQRLQQQAQPPAPTPPSRSRGWIVANGLLAVGSLSLLTATLVFRATPLEARTIPIPVPVASAAPAVAASPPTAPPAAVTPTPLRVDPIRPKPRPRPTKTPGSTSAMQSCDHNDPICGLGLD